MSSSSNLRTVDRAPAGSAAAAAAPASTRRRTLLLGLAACALLGLPRPARAGADPLAGLRRWGSGEFRRLGFHVYTATLWACADPLQPPLALRLDYQRRIAGSAIVDASLREMRRFVDDPARLQAWGESMRRVLPDVQAGDHLVGLYRPDGAHFYQGDRLLGAIETPGFAAAFFAIWLDRRTSAPELREALLTRPAS